MVSYRCFLEGGILSSNRKRGDKMATSRIFANFEITVPKTVRVFVNTLCSDKPWLLWVSASGLVSKLNPVQQQTKN